jgi:hypothetical protein
LSFEILLGYVDADPGGLINPPALWLKTNFCFRRTIYHPEYAIFQGGVISVFWLN